MATQIYLGNPPENIKQFIKKHYGPKDMTNVPLHFVAEEPNATMSFSIGSGTYETSPTSEEGSWTPYNSNDTITLANVDDKVYFRAGSDEGNETCYSCKFTINNGKIAAKGNITSLLDRKMKRPDVPDFCYYLLFSECGYLTHAPILPATILGGGCYQQMFYNCSSLIQAPTLPATSLNSDCYRGMFYSCSSLIQAPALPATSLHANCYDSMFWGCTSLTKAPILLATSFDDSCYNSIFYNCTNIPEPKYDMSHMTFNEVADVIQTNWIFGPDTSIHQIQCSDKILIATYD